MFIRHLTENPQFFVFVVVTMVFSVVLHELAHGWAAIWQGDRTPIEQGHMTIDPRVHMGLVSLLMLVMVGMCFGAMPVNPSRFKNRYSDIIVSAAGPAMNLLLAFVALTALGVWDNVSDVAAHDETLSNWRDFLWFFGYANIALCIFNMLPIPPLDGSTVLAGLHKGYRRLLASVRDPSVFLGALVVVFLLVRASGTSFWAMGRDLASHYVRFLHSIG